jgi:hypothetical protein
MQVSAKNPGLARLAQHLFNPALLIRANALRDGNVFPFCGAATHEERVQGSSDLFQVTSCASALSGDSALLVNGSTCLASFRPLRAVDNDDNNDNNNDNNAYKNGSFSLVRMWFWGLPLFCCCMQKSYARACLLTLQKTFTVASCRMPDGAKSTTDDADIEQVQRIAGMQGQSVRAQLDEGVYTCTRACVQRMGWVAVLCCAVLCCAVLC